MTDKQHKADSFTHTVLKSSACNRSDLRTALRKRRRALSADQQVSAGERLCNILSRRPELTDSQHIAVYIANDGEINPEALRDFLWNSGKQCYLPVVAQGGSIDLLFIEYLPDTPLVLNRFGIPEPSLQEASPISLEKLDIVFVPLTGFDETGRRLGMGGGFYDRTFAFTRTADKPILIGLAHECQKVASIPVEHWDIAMSGIATDSRYYSLMLST
ncbi:5-formyltetrahydrofolate cyclo-ligase [Endozoicomonas sp. SCSIO W0465]|uniref:5-formyltetrahydrofolate cyclo-ligase n=1 Tax=Endozoicomonas sp. SCSIO W0465 TaxID=2918516 RepID=UPI002075931F|nr:5-formyltetrahydrofolate cyclo-ligase [Endozoicomonas sp. SCSIO W0465]USE38158.1 5-formyltetrahydrofolate cyclo-ligase [Endozoicomonas sp. SCSIO W0465]